MDNLKLPAYPLPMVGHPDTNVMDSRDYCKDNGGFTKLELASLMIAQGAISDGEMPNNNEKLAKVCVEFAKAVLEEANK